MLKWFLVFVLLATAVRAENIPDYVPDLIFNMIQEDNVYQFNKPYRYEAVLEPKDARILRRLGCNSFECREDAQDDLQSLGRDGWRVAFWGTKSKDQNVVRICKAVIERYFRCKALCERKWTKWDGGTYDANVCFECGGSGDYRYQNDWDFESQSYVLKRRDFFPLKKEEEQAFEMNEVFENGMPRIPVMIPIPGAILFKR